MQGSCCRDFLSADNTLLFIGWDCLACFISPAWQWKVIISGFDLNIGRENKLPHLMVNGRKIPGGLCREVLRDCKGKKKKKRILSKYQQQSHRAQLSGQLRGEKLNSVANYKLNMAIPSAKLFISIDTNQFCLEMSWFKMRLLYFCSITVILTASLLKGKCPLWHDSVSADTIDTGLLLMEKLPSDDL